MIKKSLGIIETTGLITALQAAAAAAKSANVKIAGFSISGAGLAAVLLDGDEAAVQAAVKAGVAALEDGSGTEGQSGGLIASNVIPRPHREVNKLLTMLELI